MFSVYLRRTPAESKSPTRAIEGGIRRNLTVGELAKRSDLAVSALHFYESKGLISGWRSAGNQRRYLRDILRRVAVIKVAQRIGATSCLQCDIPARQADLSDADPPLGATRNFDSAPDRRPRGRRAAPRRSTKARKARPMAKIAWF